MKQKKIAYNIKAIWDTLGNKLQRSRVFVSEGLKILADCVVQIRTNCSVLATQGALIRNIVDVK